MKKLNHISFILLILSLSSCGRFSNKDEKTPGNMRIVSVSKHLTEMVYALGQGKSLVAVDLSSTYPDSAKLLKTVGYHRALSPESIIAMTPDLVIHSNDIGPENVLPQISKVGLKIKTFGSANTIDSAKLTLKELANFYGVPAKADSIIKEMDASILAAADSLKALNRTKKPKVMIIHFGRASNIYFVMSGRHGVGDKMIELAGGETAIYDAKGAKQLSAEAIAEANPDCIIATDFGFDQMGSMDKFILGVPGVALTNAGKNKNIIRFEEHDLVYFGPRSGKNILLLMKELHKK
jgi:iron complex transport system substrate-binding protein